MLRQGKWTGIAALAEAWRDWLDAWGKHRAEAQAFHELSNERVLVLARAYARSVEFMLPRNSLEGGSYRGLDGIRLAWADVYETWEDFRFQRRESRATGDYVVVLGRATNVGKGTAPTVSYDAAYVLKIEQGSIIRWQPYTSSAEAPKAVGLAE